MLSSGNPQVQKVSESETNHKLTVYTEQEKKEDNDAIDVPQLFGNGGADVGPGLRSTPSGLDRRCL